MELAYAGLRDGPWPWWVSREMHGVATEAEGLLPLEADDASSSPRKRARNDERSTDDVITGRPQVDVDALLVDYDEPFRVVLRDWARAARTVRRGPTLRHAQPMRDRVEEEEGGDGDRLTAVRRVGKDALQRVRRFVTEQAFGRCYARTCVERALEDEHVGAYEVWEGLGRGMPVPTRSKSVRGGGARLVAVFVAVAYACACGATALLVDTFVVHGASREGGIGRRAFRLLRALAPATRAWHVVFAQCLLAEDAQRFWRNKLDPSSEARALAWQAWCLDAPPVCVYDDCQVQARWYHCDDP